MKEVPMTEYEEKAVLFKAYCDEVRLQIIDLLRGGEQCACDLLERLPVGQSTLSHHMKILVNSEVVNSRRAGKWIYYRLNQPMIEKTIFWVNQMMLTEESKNTRCACE